MPRVLFMALLLVAVRTAPAADDLAALAASLKDADVKHAQGLAAAIASDLDNAEDALIALLSQPGEPIKRRAEDGSKIAWTYQQYTAAKLLGRMRSEKAISILAQRIDYREPLLMMSGITLLDVHPAAIALVQIGQPAVPALLRNIARSSDPFVRELSTHTLVQIEEGDAPRVLRRFLKYHRGTPGEPRIKEALELASELAKRFRRGPAYLEPIRRLIQFITDYSFILPETPSASRLADNVPRATHPALRVSPLRA